MPISDYINNDDFITEGKVEQLFREYYYNSSGASSTNNNFFTKDKAKQLYDTYYNGYAFFNPPSTGKDFVRGKDIDWTPESLFQPFRFTTANGNWESGISDSPSAVITQDRFVSLSVVNTF